MKIFLKKTVWLLCLTVFFPGAVMAMPVVPAELEQLVAETLENNMSLRAVAARATALEKQIPAAGALEDPRVGLGLANVPTDSFDFDQEPMTQKQIFVSQKIPWFGKRTLLEQVAELTADRQAVMLEAKKRELTRRVSDMFYRLWYLDRALDNIQRLKDLLVQIREVTETAYASGKAQEKDLIQAHLEISRLEDNRIVLETERRSLDKDLNGILNRKTFQSVKTPSKLASPAPAIEIDTLKQTLLDNNPHLRIRRIDLQMAELETELADKNFWPDSEWRLTYGQRDSVASEEMADFLSASVMFNVPLWQNTRQGPMRDAKEEMTGSARMELDNLLTTLPYEADALAGEIEDLGKNYRFYEEILMPQAEQLARSSMSSYQVGKLAFDIMIRAQIQQLEVELKADKYLQMIYVKQARLEEMAGNPARDNINNKDDRTTVNR